MTSTAENQVVYPHVCFEIEGHWVGCVYANVCVWLVFWADGPDGLGGIGSESIIVCGIKNCWDVQTLTLTKSLPIPSPLSCLQKDIHKL